MTMTNNSRNMKQVLLSFLLLFAMTAVSAQEISKEDIKENNKTMNMIKKDSEYLHESGYAETYDKAKEEAILRLAKNINTEVKSKTSNYISHTSENGEIVEQEVFSQMNETFTDVNLPYYNALPVKKPSSKNKNYQVFVYIKKSDVEKKMKEIEEKKIQERKERLERLTGEVQAFYDYGDRHVDSYKFDDVLENWYIGYIMSYQENIRIKTDDGDEVPAALHIKDRMKELMEGIEVEALSYNETHVGQYQSEYDVELRASYKGHNVTKLYYTYFDGNSTSDVTMLKDGIGKMTLHYPKDEVSFRIVYFEPNRSDKDIQPYLKDGLYTFDDEAVKFIDIASLKKKPLNVATEVEEVIVMSADTMDMQQTSETMLDDFMPVEPFQEQRNSMAMIESAIRSRDYSFEDKNSLFTQLGYSNFEDLIKYGHASIIGTPQYEFTKMGDVTLCKGLKMQFAFNNNHKFTEDVVFRFNSDNKIESLAFSLCDVDENVIMGRTKWDEDSKLKLLTLLEDYQTAYALHDSVYLDQVFSDNALIIIGNVVKKRDDKVKDKIQMKNEVTYKELSKAEYMARLKRQFKSKKFINLNFKDVEVTKASNGNLYGIRLLQEYHSDTYGDVGYLYLVVDLRPKTIRRENYPVIHARVWQSDKLPFDELVGLKDFKL